MISARTVPASSNPELILPPEVPCTGEFPVVGKFCCDIATPCVGEPTGNCEFPCGGEYFCIGEVPCMGIVLCIGEFPCVGGCDIFWFPGLKFPGISEPINGEMKPMVTHHGGFKYIQLQQFDSPIVFNLQA